MDRSEATKLLDGKVHEHYHGRQDRFLYIMGMSRSTWCRKKKDPWRFTIPEVQNLARVLALSDEQIAIIVKSPIVIRKGVRACSKAR